jgi:hypothetical protein
LYQSPLHRLPILLSSASTKAFSASSIVMLLSF